MLIKSIVIKHIHTFIILCTNCPHLSVETHLFSGPFVNVNCCTRDQSLKIYVEGYEGVFCCGVMNNYSKGKMEEPCSNSYRVSYMHLCAIAIGKYMNASLTSCYERNRTYWVL